MWKRRLVWFIFLIASLVGISFYGGTVSYGLLFAVALIPVVSLIYLMVFYFRFKVYQKVESRSMVCGEPMPYYFVLHNEDYIPFAGVRVKMFSTFSYVEDAGESCEYQLLPDEDIRHDTRLVCLYRGRYNVGIRLCEVTDFFRMFTFRYTMDEKIEAIVLPRLVKLKSLKCAGEVTAKMQRENMRLEGIRTATVRDYMPGDPIKDIHWKATARSGKLMVREQTGEEKQEIAVILDTGRYSKAMEEYIPLENKMTELAIALIYYFVEKHIPVSLYYGNGGGNGNGGVNGGGNGNGSGGGNGGGNDKGNGGRSGSGNGNNGVRRRKISSLAEFDGFYKTTAELSFDTREITAKTLWRIQRELIGSRMTFAIVHRMEHEYLSWYRQLADNGNDVYFYVVSDNAGEDILRAESLKGRVFAVGIEADLEETV